VRDNLVLKVELGRMWLIEINSRKIFQKLRATCAASASITSNLLRGERLRRMPR